MQRINTQTDKSILNENKNTTFKYNTAHGLEIMTTPLYIRQNSHKLLIITQLKVIQSGSHKAQREELHVYHSAGGYKIIWNHFYLAVIFVRK